MEPKNIELPKIYDGDEKELVNELMSSIHREIYRLQKLSRDKKTLLAKMRIVTRSCMLLAHSDGAVFEELYRIHHTIFNKYCITGKNIRKYCRSIKNTSLLAIKQDIEKHKIEQDFLEDLYHELCELAHADGTVSTQEDNLLTEIKEIFKLPFLTKLKK